MLFLNTALSELVKYRWAWNSPQYSFNKHPSFYFWVFCKKIPLSRCVDYVMDGSMDQSVSESVSQWVRDVCMSHQSDWIYYKQPIKFLVSNVNGIIQFRTAIFIPLWKRRKYLFRYFLWVRLRILVMDETSLEVWNSAWASCMRMALEFFIFSYKGNLILFFTGSKFN